MTDDLRKILGYELWSVTGVFILSLFYVAGRMAISHRRGEGFTHIEDLKWVFAACLLAGSSSLIALAVVGP